jgi:predicted transposase/invertase (TIGR01784 family)
MASKTKAQKEPRKLVSFDWAIKKLLRSKANFGILEGFLSELLHDDVKIDHLLESESNKEDKNDKFNRVDMLVKNKKDELILIEVQYEPELDYLLRMLYGASKLITEHLGSGQSYANIKKVISINLVYFELGQGKDYVYYGSTQFVGIHQNDVLQLAANQLKTYKANSIAKIYPEYYIIRINEFNDIAKDNLDQWIYFLKNEELPPNVKAKGLKEAGQKLNILKLSPEDRAAYEHFKENQRYQISLLEGSIWRAQEAEEKLAIEEAKRKEEETKRKEEETKRKEEETKRKEAEAKRKEEEARRKEGDDQIKALQEQRYKSLQNLIDSGMMDEAQAKRILGIND